MKAQITAYNIEMLDLLRRIAEDTRHIHNLQHGIISEIRNQFQSTKAGDGGKPTLSLDPPNDKSAPTTAFSTGSWEERVHQARDRKNRLLSFGPNARGVFVTAKHGLFVVDPEDSSVSANLLQEGYYAEPEYQVAKSLISKDSHVLVVGAHIGALAVPLSRDCKELVAIEANPNTFEYLRVNLILNSCSNVRSYNVAAWQDSEKIEFLLNTENSGGSKRMPVSVQIGYIYDNPEKIEIDGVALDKLLDESAFDLILMDIEGSEYFALKGMQGILRTSKVLSIEFLPHHLSCVAGVDAGEFIGTILPHFSCMYIPGHNCVVPKEEIVGKIMQMYQANENHPAIYFLKEILPKWPDPKG